jgi:hypothetical protein
MDPVSTLKIELPCKFLRCKEMYYDQTSSQEDQYSPTHWCNKTHEGFGPDGEPATKADCCAGRSCYVR